VALYKAGVGCFIGDYIVGALVYTDDIVLLAPSASALRIILAIGDKYANDYCISFNASASASTDLWRYINILLLLLLLLLVSQNV